MNGDGEGRRCQRCGSPLAPQAAFCRECGAKQQAPAAVAEAQPPAESGEVCPACGTQAREQDAFCRGCGLPFDAPGRPPAPVPGPQETALAPMLSLPPDPAGSPSGSDPARPAKRRRVAAVVGIGIAVLLGAGTTAAFLIADSGSNQATTVVTQEEPASAADEGVAKTSPEPAETAPLDEATVGSVSAGRYIEAGSFRTVDGADTEQSRLAAQGIAVEVASSDGAEELYPGFQVLLGGPVSSASAEKSLLRSLRANGVPSAFARELNPAEEIAGTESVAGTWIGQLERTGSERPGLDGPLNVTLIADPDGSTATLHFDDDGCSVKLLAVTTTSVSLGYQQEGNCVGTGTWWLRPSGDGLMLTLLPPNTETIVLGTLERG